MIEQLIKDPRAALEKAEDALMVLPEMAEKHPEFIRAGAGALTGMMLYQLTSDVAFMNGAPALTTLTEVVRLGASGAAGLLIFKKLAKLRMSPAVDTESASLAQVANNPKNVGKALSEYRTEAAERIKLLSLEKHVFFDAGTGGGKTVFTTAMAEYLVQKYNWEYFVIDPKTDGDPEQKWPSATLKLYDQATFIPFLKQANAELTRRKNDPNKNYRHMVIIIDEAPEVTGVSEEAVKLVARLSKLGFAFHIHVWLASQSSRIAEVGFAGRKDVLLQNFTGVKLQETNGVFEFASMRRSGEDFKVVGQYFPTPHLWHGWKVLEDKPVEDSNLLRAFGGGGTDTSGNLNSVAEPTTDTRQHSAGSSLDLPQVPRFPSVPPTPQAVEPQENRLNTENGRETENGRAKLMGIMLRASDKGIQIDRVLRAIQAHEAGVSITEITRILLDLTGDVGGPNRTKTRYVLGVE